MPSREEEKFTKQVVELAKQLGLHVHHCNDSRYACWGQPGFPDLIIAGIHGTIFAELKTATGMTSANQDEWIWMLARAGTPVFVWRPGELSDGTIRTRLETLT